MARSKKEVGNESYDLIVIGGGPAGQKAAIQGAKLKKRVCLIDNQETVGGACVHHGTIPSKSFREAVIYLSGYRQRTLYGSAYRVKSDISIEDLIFRATYVRDNEVNTIEDSLHRNRVELLRGHAKFIDAHTLEIDCAGEKLVRKGKFILIATGAKPFRSAEIQFNGKSIFDSDDLLTIKEIPRSMTVIGGGVIGVEYASMFAAMGVAVTVIDGRDKLLEFIDREIVDCLLYWLRSMGIAFKLGEQVVSCRTRNDGQVTTTLQSGKVIVSESVLFSAGRVSNTDNLGLEKLGIKVGARGKLIVNEYFQTTQPHIYAAGDVIGFPALASTSAEQGRLSICHAFKIETEKIDRLLPYGIYSIPEIAIIGQHEQELTEAKIPYEVGIASYKEVTKGYLVGDQNGMLKILFHRQTLEILGVHIIGESASELIHIGQAVMTYGGTLKYFLKTVFNYPTLSTCYKVAALNGYNRIIEQRDE